MKPPPLLLGATLLFWGWQIGLPWVGAALGVLVEAAWVLKARWDLADEDFERIWTLCSVLLLAGALYAFTANEGVSTFGALVNDANFQTQRQATLATARTAANLLRWLPIIFFPFLLAQTFNTRATIPLTTISHIMQRRWKLARQAGENPGVSRGFNIGYPYFCMALLSASFHPANDNSYFWGFSGLLVWALWGLRSRRYSPAVWASIILTVVAAGYFGQRGVNQLQRYLESFNAQWLARFMRRADDPFQSRTAMGRIGQLKLSDRIVIWLEPQTPRDVPPYLREASFRLYDRQAWLAGSSRDDFTPVTENPPGSAAWALVPGKRTFYTVNVACYLDGTQDGLAAGLLPLPSGTARLDHCPAFSMKANTAGAVLAQGPRLLLFNAHFGPGATHDAPPGVNTIRGGSRTNAPGPDPGLEILEDEPGRGEGPPRLRRRAINEDLDVPEREQPALDAIIEELQLRDRPLQEVLPAVANFFDENFSYSLWQNPPRLRDTNATVLSRFLQQTRSGHCEYFATATALLLRQLEIPTRYATGFAVNEKDGAGYVVRLSDAHAWTLVWDAEKEHWFDFDTTPASWVELDRNRASSWRWLGDAWARVKFEFAKFRSGQGKARQYLVWIIAPGLLLLLYQILFRRGRSRKKTARSDAEFLTQWPGLDSDFYQLEQRLAAGGLPRGPAEPLRDWLLRLSAAPEWQPLRTPLEELLRLHYRHRFDPVGLTDSERQRLRQETKRCLECLDAMARPAGTTAA
jgi:protein-glutamine gamma-glutamyltransferase